MPSSRPIRRLLILTLLAGGLLPGGSGAAEVTLSDRWRLPEVGPTPFKRLLAVGITTDAPMRRRLEDRLVSMLRGREVACLTSYSLVTSLPPVEESAKVVDQLLAQEVDGVITVTLVPLEKKEAEEEWAASWRQALGETGRLRAYIESSLGRISAEASRQGVEVSLWNLETRQRVWAGRTDGNKIKKLRKEASGLVEEVTNELIHERLL